MAVRGREGEEEEAPRIEKHFCSLSLSRGERETEKKSPEETLPSLFSLTSARPSFSFPLFLSHFSSYRKKMSTNRPAADQLAALQQRMARREAQRGEKREARMVSLRKERDGKRRGREKEGIGFPIAFRVLSLTNSYLPLS